MDQKGRLNPLEYTLNNHPNIIKWSIDLEDIDNVLRIEASTGLLEKDIINLAEIEGFSIQALPDEISVCIE